jgi:hypothetical protein
LSLGPPEAEVLTTRPRRWVKFSWGVSKLS